MGGQRGRGRAEARMLLVRPMGTAMPRDLVQRRRVHVRSRWRERQRLRAAGPRRRA